MELEIGFCTAGDAQAVRALYAHAFEDTPAFIDYYFEHIYRPEQVMAIREDGPLISMLHMNPYRVTLEGKERDIAYIVAVATHKDYRKRGLMGMTIDASLKFLYERGDAFCLLMPIDSRIYERYGFGFIEDHLQIEGEMSEWMLDRADFEVQTVNKAADSDKAADLDKAAVSDEAAVSDGAAALDESADSDENANRDDEDAVSVEQLDALVADYSAWSSKCLLATKRDRAYFRRLIAELNVDGAKILRIGKGYMITYWMESKLHVRECIAPDLMTLKQMGSYLKDVTDSGTVIINDTEDSPFKYYLPNTGRQKLVHKPFMMGRIVCLEAFLRQHAHWFQEGTRIQVVDRQVTENNLIFMICDNGNMATEESDIQNDLTIAGDGAWDYRISIKALTQLVFGYADQGSLPLLDDCFEDRGTGKAILKDNKKKKPLFFNEYV